MEIFELTIKSWQAILILIACLLIQYVINRIDYAPVEKGKKPIGWWYRKVMCEIGWQIRKYDCQTMYYKQLHKMCDKYKINLYGKKL